MQAQIHPMPVMLIGLIAAALVAGCGGKSSADPKAAFSPPSDQAKVQFSRKNADGSRPRLASCTRSSPPENTTPTGRNHIQSS